MKEEALEKPPALLLPPQKLRVQACAKHSSFKDKEERTIQKFTVRYDTFQGILKRVSEMKLCGLLDSEEPNTGSEKSESVRYGHLRRDSQSRSFSGENSSNLSVFEDESSVSSITGSDHSPPYEEIPKIECSHMFNSTNLPSYSAYSETNVSSFRESFPPPPSPIELYQNVSSQNSLKEYKAKNGTKRKSFQESERPKSVIHNKDGVGNSLLLTADVNENRVKYHGKIISVEERTQPEEISEAEKHQLEMFFKSLKTDVFVCGSLANLYFGWKEDEGSWSLRHTGVVVVVFDSGDTRSRSKRKIQILLAERGTCFPLWRDTVDNLSAYHKSGVAFHVMYLSYDHRQTVGLSFDSPLEADKLFTYLEELTSDPENINISVPGSKKKKTFPKKTVPLPHKKQISNPCLFQHVISVAAKDRPIYMSLQTLIQSENVKKGENIC